MYTSIDIILVFYIYLRFSPSSIDSGIGGKDAMVTSGGSARQGYKKIDVNISRPNSWLRPDTLGPKKWLHNHLGVPWVRRM